MLLKRKKQAALAILEVEPTLQVDSLKGSQLKILLAFFGVKNKDQEKNVAEMKAKYSVLKETNATPQRYQKWTESDKEELTNLKDDEIELKDTDVGRYEQNQKIVMKEIARKMSLEDKMKFVREIIGEEAVEAVALSAATNVTEQGYLDLSTIFEDPYAAK